jgi:N-hydroxyarylamine O-acetyltransferase
LSPTNIFDYLDRIHIPIREHSEFLEPSFHTLQALHEAHMLAVPFENLSIHYGQPILLEEEALFEKIVCKRRGGFCYELNGMFAWLLRQLRFQVTLLSAGVASARGGFGPEFDHLTLLVHQVEGADWLADVGFGDSFLQPWRFEAEVEQRDIDGRSYRLLREEHVSEELMANAYWILQQWSGEQWEAQYRFTLQPRQLPDYLDMCHYQQTSPESHFTQHRICSLATSTGRITLSDLRLITTIHGERHERLLASEEQYRRILAELFGIVL